MSRKRKFSNESEGVKRVRTESLLSGANQHTSPTTPTASPTTNSPSVPFADFDLNKLLPTLDKGLLVKIISELMSEYPQLSSQISSKIPKPSLSSVGTLLDSKQKSLQSAFPYSRNNSGVDNTSDYTYNRTRGHIQEILNTITTYLPYFTNPLSFSAETSHEFPANAMDYLHMASCTIHALPHWQNESHNIECKHEMYSLLAKTWHCVVRELARRAKENGKIYGSLCIQEWSRVLNYHSSAVGGHFGYSEVVDEFNKSLGWIGTSSASGISGFGGGSPWPIASGLKNNNNSNVEQRRGIHAPMVFNA